VPRRGVLAAQLAGHAIRSVGAPAVPFTELQALNFIDGVVEMGHDCPSHLAISARRPLAARLGVYHGNARGVSGGVRRDPGR